MQGDVQVPQHAKLHVHIHCFTSWAMVAATFIFASESKIRIIDSILFQ